MSIIFLFRLKGGVAADLHRDYRHKILHKAFGVCHCEWHSQVGDLSAEEALVVGAVFVVGVDVLGQASLVDHVPAGRDQQHRLMALQDVERKSVREAHAAQKGQGVLGG